jgi:glycine/D-amino acid oxidase-like deaminating enzyme/nitrite reductase/ring-hydroxylating ferredoxin subunit
VHYTCLLKIRYMRSSLDEMTTSGKNISYWTNSVQAQHFDPLKENLESDVVIVGGGIAGLSVAWCLVKAGKQVVLVEDGFIGSGESGRTTAHLVTSLDDRYYRLEELFGAEGSKMAAESHAAAIDQIEKNVLEEKIECDFERLDGYLFLHPSDKKDALDKEYKAASKTGLPVEMLESVPGIGFEKGSCIHFPRQGQFHIMKYLNGLCLAIEKRNGRIFTGTHAKKIDHTGITTNTGYTVKAKHIVVCTNTPVNDLYAIHTKQSPHRSYVIGAKVKKGSVRKALWWDTGDHNKDNICPPYHYVRLQPFDETHDLLLSGGEDHVTGKADEGEVPEEKRYEAIELWTRDRFPIGDVIYRWSGQVMETMDCLAYMGRNPMDKDNVYIITGDSGNGMTHATIGGMLITDLIMGKSNPWEKLYDPGRFKFIKAGKAFIKDNMSVLAEFFKNSETAPAFSEVKKGEGKVVEIKGDKFGVHRDNGNVLHIVSATCPHLKCTVKWNNDEKSWDCPCHGSRFTIKGKVMNGPANVDLLYSSSK